MLPHQQASPRSLFESASQAEQPCENLTGGVTLEAGCWPRWSQQGSFEEQLCAGSVWRHQKKGSSSSLWPSFPSFVPAPRECLGQRRVFPGVCLDDRSCRSRPWARWAPLRALLLLALTTKFVF